MGGFFISERYANMMADEFLNTPFLSGFDEETATFLDRAFHEIQDMEKRSTAKTNKRSTIANSKSADQAIRAFSLHPKPPI